MGNKEKTAKTRSIGHYYEMLSRYLLPQRRTLIGLAALLFASIGLQLVNPQIIRYFIDTAQSDRSLEPLYYAALLFIGFSLFQQLISVVATYVSENLAWRTTNELRGDLAEHGLKLDMSFHKSNTTGSIIERVDGDVNALANFFSSFIIHLAGNLLLMTGIIILLFRENVLIGAGMLLFVIGAVFVINGFASLRCRCGRSGGRSMPSFTALSASIWRGRRIPEPTGRPVLSCAASTVCCGGCFLCARRLF